MMSEKKYQLHNRTRFSIGITHENGFQEAIRPGDLTIVTASKLKKLIGRSDALRLGHLYAEGADELLTERGVVIKDIPNLLSDADLKAKLSGGQKQLKDWLDTFSDGATLERVAKMAAGMGDLTAAKIKLLEDKLGKPLQEYIEAN